MKRTLIITGALILLNACAVRDHGLFLEPVPDPKPIQTTIYDKTPGQNNGSIFSANNASATLISDTKAYRVNDIVVIAISESTTAVNSATTSTDKETKRDLGIPSLFGLESSAFPNINSSITPASLVSTSTEGSHTGTGSTSRAGQFTGTVAARVLHVLPNGYLFVQGYKNVQVNGEQGKIYLSGIVNPLLIAKDHSIKSNQVADLELFYGGSGIVGGSQNPGWLTRLLDVIWPF